MVNGTNLIKSYLYLKVVYLRPELLINHVRILEYFFTESIEIYSRKNHLSGYGISPSSLDKKDDLEKFYSEIYGKRHPKKGIKKLPWKGILDHFRKKQNSKMLSADIPLGRFTPESLEKWFNKNQKKFRKRPQLTSRFFRKYKNSLLQERLIIELDHSNKKTKFFSLTPLGICVLLKNRGFGFHGDFITKALKILNTFYLQYSPKILGIKKKFNFEELVKISSNKPDHNIDSVFNQFLYHNIEYSKSELEDNALYIYVRYPISFNLENIIARFVLREKEIKYYENLVVKEGLLISDYLGEKEFHTYLATFFLYGICYYIIKTHFDDFMSSRKFTHVDDFKYSDYDYILDRIKKYDKELLKPVSILNSLFSKLLGENEEISKQLNFFQRRVKEFESGKVPNKKKYKMDPNRWSYGEVSEVT